MPDIPAPSNPLHVRFGDFEIDESNAQLLHYGRPIALSPTPFGLLCALLRQSGSLLTKHVLLDQVWGHRFVSDSVLKGAISDVRNALGDDPRQPRYIETVPRRGYRFIATLLSLPDAARPASQATSTAQAVPPSQRRAEVEAEPVFAFVGRAAELLKLGRASERAAQGNRAIMWIAGEPGIGKTTLIEHFAAGLAGVVCVRGQCVQHHGAGEPYLPVLEALAELCRRFPDTVNLLRSVAPTWLLQLPWLSSTEQREALLHELAGANPQRMLREMGEFLDRFTEQQPLLLITEDLHWGDRSTFQLIDYLARRRSNSRLMWLSSFRLTEIIALDHPLNALRHELRAHRLCEELVLDAFSEAEVATFVAARAPLIAADERVVRTMHERTGGVPLFIAALLTEVNDRAATGKATPAQLASTALPGDLGALIDHYVTRLTSERRELLNAAAVCGMAFHADTLVQVLGRDPTQIADTCDDLVRERLWLMEARNSEHGEMLAPSYAFRHALFRQRIYDGVAASARAALHRKVGVALEAQRAEGLDISAAALATHFDLGKAPTSAVPYYIEAAQAAQLHLSPSEVMSLTERALTLAAQLPPGAERLTSEISLSTLRGVAAFHSLGAGDAARDAYRHASALLAEAPLHPMAGLALHGLGILHYLRAEYPEALAVAERAETLARQNDDPLLVLAAHTVKGQVLVIQGQPVAARDTLEQALPLFERASAVTAQSPIGFMMDPLVTVLAVLSMPLSQLGLFNQARERLHQAYERARHIAQPVALMVTIWCDALCAIRRGDVVRVSALAEEMQALVDKYVLAQGKAPCRWFRGWAEAHYGDPLAGFKRIREAFDENLALGMIAGSSETLGYAAEALLLHGDADGAQAQLDQAFDIVTRYGERIVLPQLLLTHAGIERLRGNVNASQVLVRRAIQEAREQGAGWLELIALTDLLECGTPTPEERRATTRLVDQFADMADTSLLARARSSL